MFYRGVVLGKPIRLCFSEHCVGNYVAIRVALIYFMGDKYLRETS